MSAPTSERSIVTRGRQRLLYKDDEFQILHDPRRVGRAAIALNYLGGGGAMVLPILPDGRIIMVVQHRPAVRRRILQLPGGAMKQGEGPRMAAQRELIEETGCVIDDIRFLQWFYPFPHQCNAKVYGYCARVRFAHRRTRIGRETLTLQLVPLGHAIRMSHDGQIRDLSTAHILQLFDQQCRHTETGRRGTWFRECAPTPASQ